ncbi:unnamed protein product [Jaminaea pallidilutea]
MTDPSSSSSAVAVLSTSQPSQQTTVLRLHPLPILSISEHLVRVQAQQQGSGKAVKVYGALLGTQDGQHVEVHNTFEVKVDESSGAVDHTFFKSRQAQYKQTFPTFDFLGWYSNGLQPSQLDLDIHKQFLEYNESPLYLQLSPDINSLGRSGGELPLQLYESHVEISAGQQQETSLHFVQSSGGYKIETGEAERIAVDYANKPAGARGSEGDHGALISSLESQQSAIRMLQSRIQTAHAYVQSLTAPQQDPSQPRPPRDHETLRQIKAILATLPQQGPGSLSLAAARSDGPSDQETDGGFRDHFLREYNDAMLTTALARMTKGLSGMNELVDKFDVVHGRSSSNRDDEPEMVGSGSRRTQRLA